MHGAAELQPAEEALPSHDAHRTLASGVPAVHKRPLSPHPTLDQSIYSRHVTLHEKRKHVQAHRTQRSE